jgi:hypothetical protein
MGLVLPSETWGQSGGVNHWFESIITGERSLLLDEMMMAAAAAAEDDDDDNGNVQFLFESLALRCVFKHVGRLLML